MKRAELSHYINQFLKIDLYKDYAPNGLQIEGRASIKRIATAVSASMDVIQRAALWQADALLVHHGYFWRGEDPLLVGIKGQRVRALMNHSLNLFAYHLPLDCHPLIGNNACVAKLLSLKNIKQHRVGGVDGLLWSGELQQTMSVDVLTQFFIKQLMQRPLVIQSSKPEITRIALCTGAAQDYIVDASELHVDAYLSGEVSERTYDLAKELDIHYFACGHHATERYGIQALGALLANEFQLEHQFFDTDNPI